MVARMKCGAGYRKVARRGSRKSRGMFKKPMRYCKVKKTRRRRS